MNISTIRPISNINFGNKHIDAYLDDLEAPYENEVIPEYEELDYRENVRKQDPFRTDELFDRKRGDMIDYYYRVYGTEDDVDFNDDIRLGKLPNDQRYCTVATETRRSLPANYYLNNLAKDIYTSEYSYQRDHESFQTRLNQGFKREDISKIYHSAMINKSEEIKVVDFSLAKRGFGLIKAGADINTVTKIMEDSKIHYADESSRFNEELFDFLTAYPDSRNMVVDDDKKCEKLRKDIMQIYPEINKICPYKRDVETIVNTCRTGRDDYKKIDKDLLDICIKSITNGKTVRETSKLIKNSKITTATDKIEFSPELYRHLTKYPDSRQFVVNSTQYGEQVREDIINQYPLIQDLCKDKNQISIVIKGCETGTKNKKKIDSDMLNILKNMVEGGANISDVMSDLTDAKITDKHGNSHFDKDLFGILKKYPECRNLVIERGEDYSRFRKDRAEVYPILKNACTDLDDVISVMEACELRNKNNEAKISSDLIDLALDLLKIEPDWTRNNDRIISGVVNTRQGKAQSINRSKYELAKEMSKNGNFKISSIYSVVVLNNKNPELCK